MKELKLLRNLGKENLNEISETNLICSDAIEYLKTLPESYVDLVVADPPYNSKVARWDFKDDAWQKLWLSEVRRIMKPGASFYMFFAPMNMFEVEGWIRQNLTLKNLIVWHHPNLYGAGLSYGKDRFKSTWDIVFYATKGDRAKHEKNVSQIAYRETGRGFDVMIYPHPRPLLHKAQKPLELIKKFIICSSEEQDLVLDPFCGVGTTALACEQLNRRYICIDSNSEFIEITKKRIENLDKLKIVDKEIWKQIKRQ